MSRTIGAVGAVGLVLVAAACGYGGAEPAAGEAPAPPVLYSQHETPMRYTFEQAATGRWLVPSYLIVADVVEVADPRWNTTSGLRWEDDPGSLVPVLEGPYAGVDPFPWCFQEVTVEVIEQIGGPSYYDDPSFPGPEQVGGPDLPVGPLELTVTLGLHQGAESSPQVIPKEAAGRRGLFVIVLATIPMKDGTRRPAFEVADQASYLEVAPGVAVPIRAFNDSRSLTDRMVEAARLPSVVSSTHDLVSFEELMARAAHPDAPLEQHLGYADILPPPTTTTTLATGP